MKKKLLSIILIVALVLAIGVTITACKKTKGLDEAAESFSKMNKTTEYNKASMELPVSYAYEGVTYQIEWSASIDNVTFAKANDKVTLTATRTTEVQSYTLTATLKDADGNTKAVEFRATVPANANAGGEYGDAYYLYVDQMNLGKIEWLKGTVSQYSSADTSDKKDYAVEFFMEDVTGGKKIFTLDGTTKNYFGATESHNNDNGKTYQNLTGGVTDASNSLIWTISEDKVLTTVIGGKTYYFVATGTSYSPQLTAEPALTNFPVKVAADNETVNPTATIKASALNENSTITFTSPAPVDGKVTANVGAEVKFTVAAAQGCELQSVKIGTKTLTATSGVYTTTLEKNTVIDVKVNNPGARAEYVNETIDMTTCQVTGDAAQRVYVFGDATITNVRGDAADPCKDRDSKNPQARFYQDSTFKIEYTGMLRIELDLVTNYNEGLIGMEVDGWTILSEGNKAALICNSNDGADVFQSAKLGAQIRVAKITIYTADDSKQPVGPTTEGDGTLENPYTAADGKAIGEALATGSFTENEVYLEAYVIATDYTFYDAGFKNITLWLADTVDGEKTIEVFRGSLADATKIPFPGDKVLVKGYIQHHSSAIEFATNSGSKAEITVKEVGTGNIKSAATNDECVEITFTSHTAESGVVSAQNGTTVTFTVSVGDDHNLISVKVYGIEIKATSGVYSVQLGLGMEIEVVVESKSGPQTLHTVTILKTEIADANKTNQYNATWSYTYDGVTLSIENFSNNNAGWDYIKAGQSTSKSGEARPSVAKITTGKMSETITSIVVTIDSFNKADNINEVYIEVSSTADFAEGTVTKIKLSELVAGDAEFTIADPKADMYYRLVVDNKGNGSANGAIQISKIVFKGIAAEETPAE